MSAGEYLARIAPYGFSGSCLVARGDGVELAEGYGLALRASAKPNTADTVLSLGSLTKQFTAAAILRLEEQGRLSTGDGVARFVDVPADKRGVTLHQLLTHTSGLVGDTGPDYEACEREEALERMLGAPLRFAPGRGQAYSNAGYSLLAAVIELVSGESYEGFLRHELFSRAGMEATGYRLPPWERHAVAHWYTDEADEGTPLDKPFPSWHLVGNGDMLSTVPTSGAGCERFVAGGCSARRPAGSCSPPTPATSVTAGACARASTGRSWSTAAHRASARAPW